jgi:hypothetical protein
VISKEDRGVFFLSAFIRAISGKIKKPGVKPGFANSVLYLAV